MYWSDKGFQLAHTLVENETRGAQGPKAVSSFPSRTIVCAGVSSDRNRAPNHPHTHTVIQRHTETRTYAPTSTLYTLIHLNRLRVTTHGAHLALTHSDMLDRVMENRLTELLP